MGVFPYCDASIIARVHYGDMIDDEDYLDSDGFQEFAGELIRESGGFTLVSHVGPQYSLELPRMPVDHIGKNVIVTGELGNDGKYIIAHYVRADAGA